MKKIFTLILTFIAISMVVSLVAYKIINRAAPAEEEFVAVESDNIDPGTDVNTDLSADSENVGQTPTDLPVSFNLTDENGVAVTGDALKGKISIVNFVFRSCTTVCPFVMSKTRGVMSDLTDHYDQLQLISITVDPTNDTPAALKEWKAEVAIEGIEWRFLTGEKSEVFKTVRNEFKQTVMDNAENMEMPIAHSSYLALVGADGRIANYYDSNDNFKMKELTETAAKLAADLKSTSLNH